MTTWIFDTDTRDEALASWVERQKATGHPKAIANAEFVSKAIIDFLESDASLFKNPPTVEINATHNVITKNDLEAPVNEPDKPEETKSSSFSIDEMLAEWNK